MYIRKNQPAYVVIAVNLTGDKIYYHCAGSALSMKNAMRYAEAYENHLKERGYILDTVDDQLENASYYESVWIGDPATDSQTFVKIQKTALME